MSSNELIDTYMTAPEAAKFLGLTRNRIGRLCLSGRFKGAVKKDRFWLIPREEVEHYTKLKTGPKTQNTILNKAIEKADNLKKKDAENE